jgi:xanthine/uracil/vitamin C permease (AzgA family)
MTGVHLTNRGHQMKSATTWVGIFAFLFMALLLTKKIRWGMLAVIAFVSIISWFRDTSITQFPNDDIGDAKFDYFKEVSVGAADSAARFCESALCALHALGMVGGTFGS